MPPVSSDVNATWVYFHASFTFAWMLSNMSTRGRHSDSKVIPKKKKTTTNVFTLTEAVIMKLLRKRQKWSEGSVVDGGFGRLLKIRIRVNSPQPSPM